MHDATDGPDDRDARAGVTYGDAVSAASRMLGEAGVTPGPDAELLLAHVTGSRVGEVRARAITGAVLDATAMGEFAALVERRAAREPLQHITGVAHFRQIELQVGPGVFVPRPETELLVDLAIGLATDVQGGGTAQPLVVDLGTGSGAIAISIAVELPTARVVAVEASEDALAWTRRNVAALAPSIRLERGDFATALADLDGTVDVLVTNPPYVPEGMVPRDPEVRDHDPAAALYSGADGLDAVRVISRRGLALVRRGGGVAIEHAEHQGDAIREILEADGWTDATSHLDLAGRVRHTVARR